MIKSPFWKPAVVLSISVKQDLMPVIVVPALVIFSILLMASSNTSLDDLKLLSVLCLVISSILSLARLIISSIGTVESAAPLDISSPALIICLDIDLDLIIRIYSLVFDAPTVLPARFIRYSIPPILSNRPKSFSLEPKEMVSIFSFLSFILSITV